MPDPPRLRIRALRKEFRVAREVRQVLDGLDLDVAAGEFATVLGPSGSGKSTLLNVIAGLDAPTSGEIHIDTGTGGSGSPDGSAVAYLPQKDLLFPWRTVQDNTALGLEVQGMRRREARARVAELFPVFGLEGYENAYPAELSGGMRQRAALLRTVVLDRPVLLLDEPFGALDSLTRTDMQLWLAGMWQQFRWTVLLVTHDVREAVFLGDSVHVLTPRPARVAARFEVPIPHPRSLAVYTGPELSALEGRLLTELPPGPAGLSGRLQTGAQRGSWRQMSRCAAR